MLSLYFFSGPLENQVGGLNFLLIYFTSLIAGNLFALIILSMRKIQNDELGRLTVDDFKTAEKRPLVLILDDVRSLNNIGSAFRTADAFRCESIYLCGITATPPHREIHKTALGAEESVAWKYEKNVTDAIKKLKSDGYTIIAIEQAEGGIMLNEFQIDATKKYALIFGHHLK